MYVYEEPAPSPKPPSPNVNPPTQQPAFFQKHRILITGRVLAVVLTLAMLALLGRVVQLQYHPDPLIEARIGDRGNETKLLPRRGALLDCRGRPLAMTHLGYRLYADPGMIDPGSDFAAHVANAIDDDPARIERLLDERSDRRYAVITPLLSDAQLHQVRDLRLTGLGLEPRPIRTYPQGTIAGQVIGFVGAEHKGLDGLEFALDSILQGRGGEVITLRDARRRPLWIEQVAYTPPHDGNDIRLSIDAVIQRITENELEAACLKHRAKSGQIVVMDSRTGQLVAMANWPRLDPAEANNVKPEHRKNRCITDPFEPGSVFKPFMHAAATQEKIARGSQPVDATLSGVWVTPHGRRLHDAHPHGMLTWDKGLVVSSNIVMGKICAQMGSKKMYDWVRAFGFGSLSGTGLPGESVGIVNDLKKWGPYSLTSVPMGQEVGVTSVQMARAFSAFANGGLMVTPSVLADEMRAPIVQKVLERSVADHTRGLMRQVVTEGTGRRAQSDLYQIWGKTGTAQVADRKRGGYKPRAYNASFIGAAPLNDPRLVVVVTVTEPDPAVAHFGGVVAAPIARNILEQSLTYLGVPRDAEPKDDKGPKKTDERPRSARLVAQAEADVAD